MVVFSNTYVCRLGDNRSSIQHHQMHDRSKNLPQTSDVSSSSLIRRNMDDATTWIHREDKQYNNQPHPLDNESLLASSLNWFCLKPVMMDDDWHGERWIAAWVHFSGDKQNEVNTRYKLFKPALREGHPTSAIPAEYTCVREGMLTLRRVLLRQFTN